MHHVLHVTEAENRVEQTTSLRGFEVDFLDATRECCAHQPADDTFARAVTLMLRSHVDVHQISTMACGIVRRGHLIVEAQSATAHDRLVFYGEAGDMTAIVQCLAIVVNVLLTEFGGVSIGGDGEYAMQHLHAPLNQKVKVIERCLTNGDVVMHTAVPPFSQRAERDGPPCRWESSAARAWLRRTQVS